MCARGFLPARLAALLLTLVLAMGTASLAPAAALSTFAAPGNDDFANATSFALTDSSPLTGSNVDASMESGEPGHGAASVWWRFTAPTAGQVGLSTAGSDFDTILSVYTGPAVDDLDEVASNDDCDEPFGPSCVDFAVDDATTYHVAVAGYGDEDTGSITLGFTWTPAGPPGDPPANDDFDDAIDFSLTGPSPLTGSNVQATTEDDEPAYHGGASVWWRFTAPSDGELTLSTEGSSFDTKLAVYTGSALADLTLVDTNDDAAGGDGWSLLEIDVEAGTTYHVAVGGYGDERGSITLGFVWEAAPPRGKIAIESPLGSDEQRVDFGTVSVGSGARRTIYVRNVGTAPLTVGEVDIATRSFAAGEYRIVSDAAGGTTIPPGEHREVVVEFAPKSAPTGPPNAVQHEELLADVPRITVRYVYGDTGQLSALIVFTYFRNAGGPGSADYTAVAAIGETIKGERSGTTTLVGGDAYQMRTVVTVSGGTGSEETLAVTLPTDFSFTHVFRVIGLGSNPYFTGVGDVEFSRLPDAALVVLSDDPNAQGDEFGYPAGTRFMLLGVGGPNGGGPGEETERWAGADRFATAAAVSAKAFPDGADVAFVATGANFPDALAGGPAGVRAEGPILLTAKDSLPQATITELQRLNPDRIVVLGGTAAVSEAVRQQLAPYAQGGVTRWAGTDRFATAAAVSAQAFPDGSMNAFIATGANFPDALAGGPPAGLLDSPILLTGRDALPAATVAELQRLEPQDIIVLGGTGVVSPHVEQQLAPFAAGDVHRWAGADRFATAAAVSANGFPGGADAAFIATGANFPDALAGGPAGGMLTAPILLTSKNSLPAATITELQRLNPERIIILGGPGAVSDAVAIQLQQVAP
jgi:putative cell wall-binding protein